MSTRTSSDLAVPVATEPVIVFPNGLVGCESWKQFVLLVDDEEDLPVAVLRCLDEPDVALMVTDPALALPTYEAHMTAEERAEIGLAEGEQPTIYCTLSITPDGWVTANLLGPLAVNPRTRRGKQLVQADSPYSNRHLIARVDAANPHNNEADQCSS